MPYLNRFFPRAKSLHLLLVLLSITLAAARGATAEDTEVAGERRTTLDGVYSEEQAARGQETITVHCAICHGPTLRGTRVAPGIAGVELLILWNGRTLGELYEYMRTTMPPAQVGIVSDSKYLEVLATMLQSSGFPANQQADGGLDPGDLDNILIMRD